MNKLKFIAPQWAIILLSLCLAVSTADANTTTAIDEMDVEMSNRISNISSQVDLKLTPQVKKAINAYTTQYRKGSENLLGRVSVYFPIFEKEIRAKNLPDELKYVAIIESSLKVNAKSYVGATGLWQFMKGTGRMYGLTVNSTIDERRDVEKATAAALDYLSDLHAMFDDWTMAIAAYNCGPGNVRKAIRKSGGATDYWSIRKYLPRETQKYVPKFIAAAYLMNYYHDHELSPTFVEDEVKYTASAEVFHHVSFDKLSKETGVEVDVIKLLNPSYVKNYIPKSAKGRVLTLPEVPMYGYLDDRAILGKLLFTSANKYYGRNMAKRSVADREVLKAMNSLPLVIDVAAYGRGTADALPLAEPSLHIDTNNMYLPTQYIYHRLQKRESLNSVAKKYDGVSLGDLLRLNNIDLLKAPVAGSVIIIKKA